MNYNNTAVIYICQETGSDMNNGHAAKADGIGNGPVKTIDRLVNMLRTMRSGGILQPVTVKFMGDFYLEEPLELDVGFEKNGFSSVVKFENITFESYGEKRARLIGGRKLTGFQKDVFNGVECLSLYIPEVKTGKWHFTDLYVNGKEAARTRYPQEGTLEAVTTEFPQTDAGLPTGSKWFVGKKEDLKNIDGVEDAIVSFYHYWIDEHTPVESYDRESCKITMKNRSRFLISTSYNEKNAEAAASDLHYYLENIPQTFSKPGEWYLDVKSGKVYYIPENAETVPEDLEIFAPTLRQILVLRGSIENKVCGVRFRNLDFICSRGDYTSTSKFVTLPDECGEYASDCQSMSGAYGALSFEYAEDCQIEHCELSCLGIHAVEIGYGCKAIRVESNHFCNLGGGAVKIFGGSASEPKEYLTEYCVIRGNRIEHCGKRYAASCGILVCHASHSEISDNEISYLSYSGISAGWIWGYAPSSTYGNIIRNNHIHHIGMGELSDMGGIYTLGCQSGTVIENNLIHDVKSAYYGGWGIYNDEGSSYITIENNVVYRTSSESYHLHYGSFNTVRNNLFASGGDALVRVSRNEEHLGVLFEDNTFITRGETVYHSGLMNCPVSGIRTCRNKIWDVSGKMPVLFAIGEKKEILLSLEEWQRNYGLDEGSVVEEPEDTAIYFEIRETETQENKVERR